VTDIIKKHEVKAAHMIGNFLNKTNTRTTFCTNDNTSNNEHKSVLKDSRIMRKSWIQI